MGRNAGSSPGMKERRRVGLEGTVSRLLRPSALKSAAMILPRLTREEILLATEDNSGFYSFCQQKDPHSVDILWGNEYSFQAFDA
jgi:hypothetical protein